MVWHVYDRDSFTQAVAAFLKEKGIRTEGLGPGMLRVFPDGPLLQIEKRDDYRNPALAASNFSIALDQIKVIFNRNAQAERLDDMVTVDVGGGIDRSPCPYWNGSKLEAE